MRESGIWTTIVLLLQIQVQGYRTNRQSLGHTNLRSWVVIIPFSRLLVRGCEPPMGVDASQPLAFILNINTLLLLLLLQICMLIIIVKSFTLKK